MPQQFFSKRIPVFNTVAMLILCTVFFLLPFALRGARLAVQDIKNNVADWLPSDYPETKDLEEFRKHFIGEQFVVISGPWCKENNPAYINLKRKIFEETVEYEDVLKETKNQEEIRAHRRGDELGLMFTGTYHEDWGERRQRWLLGKNGQWYFINRKGQLYEWEGQNNVVEGFRRLVEKVVHGKNKAVGNYIDTFGLPPNDNEGVENEFYANPAKLCARPFKSVTSGPDALEHLAGPNGTLKIGNYSDDSLAAFEAKIEAHRRLTGALFGPTPAPSFRWTFESLLQHVEDDNVVSLLRSSDELQKRFDAFIQFVLKERFDDDFAKLQAAGPDQRLKVWYEMWDALEIEPPARQTCLIVTLNDPIIPELNRAVGRPLFGKVRGRILELATGECGISPENLHLGGPPCDNVAIDEEGTNTLLRLVSLSALIGISLAYFSFRSIRVTGMLFFVAGVAAIASLSYVWFAGSTLDAILLSMPSLVYVLALSAAVHLVNYYRDACHESGPETAVEKAFSHAFFPCSLAAFTTSLGLISLYTSNLIPIKKFGLFSAIAVLATVILLFTYLPAALSVWPPGYKKRKPGDPEEKGSASAAIGRAWSRVGDWVIKRHAIVTITSLILMGVAAYGITRVETSVHLLKLFDKSAKILGDYRWMETNMGKLVPMELMIQVKGDAQKEQWIAKLEEKAAEEAADKLAEQQRESGNNSDSLTPSNDDVQGENQLAAQTTDEGTDEKPRLDYDELKYDLKYSLLERAELSQRIRLQLEKFFGPESQDIVGRGMSMDAFLPMIENTLEKQGGFDARRTFNRQLIPKRDQMLEQDYLAIDENDAELWRVSLRLAALNDVDYGDFINDLKMVVEPILTAYRFRTQVLKSLQQELGEESLTNANILVLGPNPDSTVIDLAKSKPGDLTAGLVDQTYLFSDTLQDLLENRGFQNGRPKQGKKGKRYFWLDPTVFYPADGPKPEDKKMRPAPSNEDLANAIAQFDCVILLEDSEFFDLELIKSKSKIFMDGRDHQFVVRDGSKQLTAMELAAKGDDLDITAVYTGIIPIVYKSQRALLHSLIESICLAFVMIAVVMMLLLRNWQRPFSPSNMLNISGGMISMIPNVFPVVLIFGAMGLLMIKVDIGSMMTASVAMGVAVDDTIHYLNWYRQGLAAGLTRKSAIKMAYDRVATAMTQTTLIGGFGLSAFAFSTFTPTQRFGVLMLILLAAALVGDLILLPAILAGPLGRFFGKEREDARDELPLDENSLESASDLSPELRVVEPDAEATSKESSDIHPDSFKHLQRPDEKNVADG